MSQNAQSTQFYYELVNQTGAKANGVFYVTSKQQKLVTIMLTDGQITYCRGARKHGQAAAEFLASCDISQYSFKADDDYPFRPSDEVIHDEVWQSLKLHIREVMKKIKAETDATTANTTHIYRGQHIKQAVPEQSFNHEPSPQKIRMYRGQRYVVVE